MGAVLPVAYRHMKKPNHELARLNAFLSAPEGALPRPARTAYTTLRQIVQWIPEGLIDRLAREEGADIRKFPAFSHVLALLYGHISGASSLNEICDAFRLHEPEVNRIRGAVPPKRNTFSNANRTRNPDIAEKCYWAVFKNEKAVKWQVWTGLLTHLLLRFLKHISKWALSFSRLAGIVKSAVWMKVGLLDALQTYGTAGGPKRPVIVEKQLYFQGFERFSNVPMG